MNMKQKHNEHNLALDIYSRCLLDMLKFWKRERGKLSTADCKYLE